MAAIVFSAMMYIQLHIVAGMEHAIDSFSINFYKDMDIEVALSDWNMVQATLRHLAGGPEKPKKIQPSRCEGFQPAVGRVFFGFLGLMPMYPKFRYFSGVMGHLLMAL